MHLVIFEDSDWQALAPFSLGRPTFALATGMTSLVRKLVKKMAPSRLTLWVRPEMATYCRQRMAPEMGVPTAVNTPLDAEAALLIHGRAYLNGPWRPMLEGTAAAEGETLLAAHVAMAGLTHLDILENTARWMSLLSLARAPSPGRLIHSAVDLIYANDASLVEDFSLIAEPSFPRLAGPHHLVSEVDIWLGPDVTLGPGCVIDASRGPIAIAEGANIGANAVLSGPCYIGPSATIAPLANIRGGVSIGAGCKVGGEVSVSIMMDYSNKGHEGFLGQSYIGKWVNLGAGTTTSNLKNTYGEITLRRGKSELTTGRRFLGSLIGDHSKTAILTRLMSGTYVGFCSMISSTAPIPRFIPSFTFLTDQGAEPYDREKAIEVAQRVFTRRQRTWCETDDKLMSYVAETSPKVEV